MCSLVNPLAMDFSDRPAVNISKILRTIIAIDMAAGVKTSKCTTFQTAMGLLAQFFDVKAVHQTVYGHEHIRFIFARSGSCRRRAPHRSGDSLKEFRKTRAVVCTRPGNGVFSVHMSFNHKPVLFRRIFAADAELIVDR
jgi:hypothetical protein